MADAVTFLYEKQLENVVARHVDVQIELSEIALEIAVKAQQILRGSDLLDMGQGSGSTIKIEVGDIDRHVVLEDKNLSNVKAKDINDLDSHDPVSAASIEFGRAGYIDQYGIEYGSMPGLFALTRASGGMPFRIREKRKFRKRRYTKKMMKALGMSVDGAT